MSFLWFGKNKNCHIGKIVKRIRVNLWDDYKQEPEYSITDPTTLKIEAYNGELTDSQMLEMRDLIFNRCLEWKEKLKKNNVGFAKNPERHETIDIVGLNEECRKSLFDELKKNDNGIDIKINWLMES